MPRSSVESAPPGPTTSVEVRRRLVDALELDLVGPWPGHELAEEGIPNLRGRTRPSSWYLTGFIVPRRARPDPEAVTDADDGLDQGTEVNASSEESGDEGSPARKGYFPSSIGLSFKVDSDTRVFDITVCWGDYRRDTVEGKDVWRRIPRRERVSVRIGANDDPRVEPVPVPESGGLWIHVTARSIQLQHQSLLGVRSVSVFLVNDRSPLPERESKGDDKTYAFQPVIEVVPDRPLPKTSATTYTEDEDWDDDVAALHFTDSPEYAVGHGVSADWEETDGECRLVRTAWIGRASVSRTRTASVEGVELSMARLGEVRDGAELRALVDPLVDRYRVWIDEQERASAGAWPEQDRRRQTAQALLQSARFASNRMKRGIQVLAANSKALDAFRAANRAVARALTQRLRIEDPKWRPFQLAFILLNVAGLSSPKDSERKIVDLLFFPTGGGKTEAYLGLAAFAMVLRRLNHPLVDGLSGAGVSVIMRYTLRLLTLDQLARATGLVCALELERSGSSGRYGKWPFEIGLWVGVAATPNKMGRKGASAWRTARSKTIQFKEDPRNNPRPIPIELCPWCGATLDEDSFNLDPNTDRPQRLIVTCSDFDCEFSEHPLPVVAVDESIYRRLPSFLIATVDKFAALPWTGESGLLLGGANRYDAHGFYGPCDPRVGLALPTPIPGPDLIIQDELHLISGPLGTMAGLYETAIEQLCVLNSDGRRIGPKIVASTATIRRARDQVQALFGRSQTQIFPPPGASRHDSFFARTEVDPAQARSYLGVSALGRNSKMVTRRVWVALMGAAIKAYVDAGGDSIGENPADPYMSLVGYFNSLRELGGGRRIMEEEVQSTIRKIGARRRSGERRGLFRDRTRFAEVLELTSRVPTDQIARTRRKLEIPFRRRHAKGEEWSVDCALATNMISVGLDIQRLGLMTVVGQPKTAAEYIQATSRVGRDPARPGIVVTILNMYRPRDRSHFERFRHFHQTFYRSVEAASVTPFSARALDRGLAGALVGLTRHAIPELTSPRGADEIVKERSKAEELLMQAFAARAREQPDIHDADEEFRARMSSLRYRVEELLDAWTNIQKRRESDNPLLYQRFERPRTKDPLLRDLSEQDGPEPGNKFRAGRSLRDVEPEVSLRLLK